MQRHVKQWITTIATLLVLSSTGIVQAAPVIVEQILPNNGGHSVVIDGEWGFVGSGEGTGQVFCQVKVYKYDYFTHKWGNGGLGVGNTAITGVILEDEPYTQLRNTGSCNTARFGGFGNSVSTSNGLLAVGAHLAKDGGSIRGGEIFFYQFDPAQIANGKGGWVQDTAVGFAVNMNGSSDIQQDSGFGSSVSVRYDPVTNTAVVLSGAPRYDDSGKTDAGKVYHYKWDGNATPNTITFQNSHAGDTAGDEFGTAVTSNGQSILIGAPFFDTPGSTFSNDGAVFLYDDTFTYQAQFDANTTGITAGNNYNLGVSVSLSPGAESVMLLGSSGGYGSGAYQFKFNGTSYDYLRSHVNTNSGDVSQSGTTAGFGYRSRSVQLYYDNQDSTGLENWRYDKFEADYGRDISVSGTTRVMVNGNSANQAYAYYTACGHVGTLKANEWTMIGMPCLVKTVATGTPATIGEIFTDLGTYGTNSDWVMYKQNGIDYEGHQNAYVLLNEQDVMVQGQGYWIISGTDKKWQVPNTLIALGTPVFADPTPGFSGRENVAAVHVHDLNAMLTGLVIPTADIRVMLANPFPSAIDWSLTILQGNVSDFHLIDGSADGFFEDSPPRPIAYVYSAGGYQAITAGTPGTPRKIESAEGFYVRFSGFFHAAMVGDSFSLLLAELK